MDKRKLQTFCALVRDAWELLKPGIDLTLECEGYTVSFYWHEPSLNLAYYPICQIDTREDILLHREGGENPMGWDSWTEEIGDKLEELLKL